MSDNQEFDFGQLDLENSEVDSGERRLRRGRYVTKVTAASLEKVGERGTGRAVKVTFVDLAGNGSITTYINVHLPGKQEATEIGKKQLKTLLTHGGHPNPNAPGDIKTIEGLVVGVNVVTEKFKSNKTGDMVEGSGVDSWHPYFNPEGAVGLGPIADDKSAKKAASDVTDEDFDDIPF